MNRFNGLADVHSVRQMARRLADDLDQGRGLVALFPNSVDPGDLWSLICELLRGRGCNLAEIWLPDLPTDASLPAVLAERLGATWPSERSLRTIETLVACNDLPQVVHLDGFDRLDEQQRDEWLAVVRRWAAAARSVGGPARRPPAMCLLAPAATVTSASLAPDVCLSVRWWWAVPSALELRLLYRTASNEAGEPEIVSIWRENVLPSLVGNDLELAEAVWDTLQQLPDSLSDTLETHALLKNWTPKALETWGVVEIAKRLRQNGSSRSSEPPARYRELWAMGLVSFTPEYGVMLSAAALASLQDTQAIDHRLWRGQVPLLLPLLDELRLTLCERLTARYGPDWAWRWILPRSPEEADAVRIPVASGWGHLETLLRSQAELSPVPTTISVVSHARFVRNKLAHYQPVTFQDFEDLWYGGQKLQRG